MFLNNQFMMFVTFLLLRAAGHLANEIIYFCFVRSQLFTLFSHATMKDAPGESKTNSAACD